MYKVLFPEMTYASCPNTDCLWHDPANIPPGGKWYRNHGYYVSIQHGKVPRYCCRCCHKTFSRRTIDEACYLHYDGVELSELSKAWLAGKTLREIARENGISVQMVRTRLQRCSFSSETFFCSERIDSVADIYPPYGPPGGGDGGLPA